MEYFEVITNAMTGEKIIRPFTEEEIAEVEAKKAAEAAIVPESITRRQCSLQLLELGMITGNEAVEMARTGIPPGSIQLYIDTLSEIDRVKATIDFAATNYYRSNPLLEALMISNGMTNTDVDNFFIAASKL